MKPELIRHLTDTELVYCNLTGSNDSETHELVKAWKKEYEKRNRLAIYIEDYGLNRDYVNQRWEFGY